MTRSEVTSRALALAALVSIAVGLYILVPQIRARQFTPVVLETPEQETTALTIQVSGAVGHPGLYTLSDSTSLAEILTLAAADEEEKSLAISITISPDHADDGMQRVDLNHADAWLLEALPGIGPGKAQAIIEYRELYGPFHRTDELTQVPGIGSATYEALASLVTVTP